MGPRSSLNHSKNPRCILGLKIYPDRDVRDRRIDRYLTLVLETRDFERHLPIIALSWQPQMPNFDYKHNLLGKITKYSFEISRGYEEFEWKI